MCLVVTATGEPPAADQLVLAVAGSAPEEVIVVARVVILSGGENGLDMVFPFIRRSVIHSGLTTTK